MLNSRLYIHLFPKVYLDVLCASLLNMSKIEVITFHPGLHPVMNSPL